MAKFQRFRDDVGYGADGVAGVEDRHPGVYDALYGWGGGDGRAVPIQSGRGQLAIVRRYRFRLARHHARRRRRFSSRCFPAHPFNIINPVV